MSNIVCRCCHTRLELVRIDTDDLYCKDCRAMSDMAKYIVAAIVNEYNPVFRAKLASVILSNRDMFIAALLRSEM